MPTLSVLVPTFKPGERVSATLAAVFRQKVDVDFEVVVMDSGSPEADLKRMSQFPIRLYQIPHNQFHHGRTRNMLASLAKGSTLVYLSQDATPADCQWLAALVAPFIDATIAGVYARQLPEVHSSPLERFLLQELYGSVPAWHTRATNAPILFSNVSGALRRDVWTAIPFREDVPMSEDQHWARAVLDSGYRIAYEPRARVYHSHAYNLRSLFHRNLLSGRTLYGLVGRSPLAVSRRGIGHVVNETRFLIRNGLGDWIPYMLLYETVRSAGLVLGLLQARQAAPLRGRGAHTKQGAAAQEVGVGSDPPRLNLAPRLEGSWQKPTELR